MIDEAAIVTAIAGLELGPLHGAAVSLTALGSVTLTAVMIGFLYLDEEQTAAWQLTGASVVGGGITVLLKYAFMRPRPGVASIGTLTPSFPSGHATLAFGSAVVLSNRFERLRPFLFALAFLVAVTRVILGAHYPSDVIAGGLIGLGSGIVIIRYGDRLPG